MTAAELDGVPDPAIVRTIWGGWLGREREFYGLCACRVEPLTWPDVVRISGSELDVLARLTTDAFHALRSAELPKRLKSGTFRVMSTGPQAVQVFAYSASDPLDLDPDIIEVLPYFDGRPVDQALAAIEEERGLRVQKDLVRTLSDFEILVPAPEPGRVPKRHSS